MQIQISDASKVTNHISNTSNDLISNVLETSNHTNDVKPSSAVTKPKKTVPKRKPEEIKASLDLMTYNVSQRTPEERALCSYIQEMTTSCRSEDDVYQKYEADETNGFDDMESFEDEMSQVKEFIRLSKLAEMSRTQLDG